MMQPRMPDFTALSADDLLFIQQITASVADKLYRFNPDLRRKHNDIRQQSALRSFASDLRSLLIAPEHASITELGEILQPMSNANRMLLLRKRPSLIHRAQDLEEILRNYIPDEDKLLFACSLMNGLYDENIDQCTRNIRLICSVLPLYDRLKFQKAAFNYISQERKKRQALIQHPFFSDHANSFSAGLLFSLASIACDYFQLNPIYKYASAIGAAGFFVYGLHDLTNNKKVIDSTALITKQWYSFWSQTKSPSTQPPEITHSAIKP